MLLSVDKTTNPRDGSPALLIQDDGGGMHPESIRHCMSFGFSDKKKKNAIGQYEYIEFIGAHFCSPLCVLITNCNSTDGNGFKTSRDFIRVLDFSLIHLRCHTLLHYHTFKSVANDLIFPEIILYKPQIGINSEGSRKSMLYNGGGNFVELLEDMDTSESEHSCGS
ncbi:hypothetical protein POM88_012835 [Heracleum sosnowskyi]|uniref:Uncharacterized protein n=1 Tax=Heracleum sosnowskyi TaxID=360622 RepID=A0AAD8IYX1_9APIA|nr:hypothetical protein POM88_012835 [Heracleum sosnowskyi]